MGHGFGNLHKIRGIVTYRLSPFVLNPFAGMISKSVPNVFRRISAQFPYIAPPAIIAYTVYDQVEKEHHRLMLKNPADYEDEK